MAFVAVAASVGTFVGLSGTAAIIGGGALIGAGVGGLYSGITGDGDILNSMLTGGLIGGAGAFGLNAMGVGAGTTAAAETAAASGATGLGTAGPAATSVNTVTAAQKAAEAASLLDAAAVAEGSTTAGMASQYATQEAAAKVAAEEAAKKAALTKTAGLTGKEMLGYGLAGTTALSLLGGRQKGAGAGPLADPGMIRPFEYSSTPNQPTGNYPSPYATASYDASGNPIMDTRERNYFDQDFVAMTPYSAKTGTLNPNLEPVTTAASGGLMFDDESGMDEARGLMQGNLQKGLFGMGYANGGIPRFADKGMVDEEAELRRTVMNNLQKLAPEQLQDVMGYMNPADKEKQFLFKHMPGYAESMRPSISGMVENAQYGDRMAQSFGADPRAVNFQPRIQDAKNYGGIASIGQQIDPNTRVNMVADLQRTPYDRNAMESVRRVGAGIDRRIGNDGNLSAYYEQDPRGLNKSGGVRYTQQFNMGGAADLGDFSDGGRLLKGPGDGVSDDIPATIAGKQPARLADGEFVIPARIVSEIGNGSTDAGAKRLYAMMDRIQDGRKKTIGKKNVAKDTKAKKHLLA
jgi:hypothetical protein